MSRRTVRALLVALGVTAVAAAVASSPAMGADDGRGNTISVRVETQGVSGAPYVRALRRSVHGPEISRVSVRVVTPQRVREICGGAAEACYSGRRDGTGTIVVPVATGTAMEATLLHEYGHHVDNTFRHRSGEEPNGTPRWWSARGMSARVARGQVAPDYSLGWERSTGEIFAEDYVRLNLALPWRLSSVGAPADAMLTAIRRDVTGSAAGEAPRATDPVETPREPNSGADRLEIRRSGVVGGRDSRSIPFGLLGPGRSVDVTARLAGDGTGTARLRVRVVCDGRVVAAATAAQGRPAVVRRTGLGPAECEVRLTNPDAPAVRVAVRVSLTRPST